MYSSNLDRVLFLLNIIFYVRKFEFPSSFFVNYAVMVDRQSAKFILMLFFVRHRI